MACYYKKSENIVEFTLPDFPEAGKFHVTQLKNTISPSQMMKLAKALDISGRSFVWVIRPPLGFDINAEFVVEQWLPEGFLRSTQNRGLMIKNWAPQLGILEHESVPAFINHCGWNLVVESLKNGVYNVRFLAEEIRVCVGVGSGGGVEVGMEDIVEKIDL
ncbi:hypothetical protein BUALT_Bualt13G0031500 [Buddleja alternifolia]|uniref:Uncharacterized protein n=1 Tax=Buddleja alternifolia TaxID=168488 RepID=A0AAV6WV58_9LAMI|nr:hypothetical protein BUALT_Bualt13G0031500 [Buddleja alternifolia]